jgi:DNA gyrase subunit A
MCLSDGTVKKTALTEFSRPRTSGIIAVDLRGSQLVSVGLTDGNQHILMFSDSGKAIRFSEQDVRPMGRSARGVRGISLKSGQTVVSMLIANPEVTAMVLPATEHGYGKRSPLSEYPLHNRGGQGVIAIQANERNGRVIGAELVEEDSEIMLITTGGTLIRTRVAEISQQGRNTQGVRLIDLEEGEQLVGLDRVAEAE